MGLLAVITALFACKDKPRSKSESQVARASAAASLAAPTAKPPRTTDSDLAKLLDATMRDPAAHSTSKDDTGTKTVTFQLKPIEGVALAYFVGLRGQKQAWRFGLEGIRCDRLDELGFELVELKKGDGRRLSASWYRIKGGLLEGILVKTYPGDEPGICTFLPGTPPYWEHQGEKPGE